MDIDFRVYLESFFFPLLESSSLSIKTRDNCSTLSCQAQRGAKRRRFRPSLKRRRICQPSLSISISVATT